MRDLFGFGLVQIEAHLAGGIFHTEALLQMVLAARCPYPLFLLLFDLDLEFFEHSSQLIVFLKRTWQHALLYGFLCLDQSVDILFLVDRTQCALVRCQRTDFPLNADMLAPLKTLDRDDTLLTVITIEVEARIGSHPCSCEA